MPDKMEVLGRLVSVQPVFSNAVGYHWAADCDCPVAHGLRFTPGPTDSIVRDLCSKDL